MLQHGKPFTSSSSWFVLIRSLQLLLMSIHGTALQRCMVGSREEWACSELQQNDLRLNFCHSLSCQFFCRARSCGQLAGSIPWPGLGMVHSTDNQWVIITHIHQHEKWAFSVSKICACTRQMSFACSGCQWRQVETWRCLANQEICKLQLTLGSLMIFFFLVLELKSFSCPLLILKYKKNAHSDETSLQKVAVQR